MKTKFILHGGFTPKATQQDDYFFQEIVKDTPQTVRILLVYFAKELDRINLNKEEDIVEFNKNKGAKTLIFDTANEESFVRQAAEADVIYLHGGRSLKLLDTLKKFPNLKKMFDGKIIAADSAGVNALSVVFYSQSANGVFNGLGIIPFKTICHYSEENKNIFNDNLSNIEILLLSEYQTKIYYTDL